MSNLHDIMNKFRSNFLMLIICILTDIDTQCAVAAAILLLFLYSGAGRLSSILQVHVVVVMDPVDQVAEHRLQHSNTPTHLAEPDPNGGSLDGEAGERRRLFEHLLYLEVW
jgi:hypothetical protein